MLLLIIYLSAIETRICRGEMSLIESTAFGFAQNTIHDFQNTVLNSKWHVLDKCHKNGGKAHNTNDIDNIVKILKREDSTANIKITI